MSEVPLYRKQTEEGVYHGWKLAWFRGGLVFEAHRWLYHSTLGSRVIKKKRKLAWPSCILFREGRVQGYLAHKKTTIPLRPP